MTQPVLSTPAPATLAPPDPGIPVAPPLLERVLKPYRAKDCVYLQSLRIVDGGGVRAVGSFAIPQSCYIDETGHLNAAEVIICYNQMLYTVLAVAVRDRLVPALQGWTEADYWARQLDGVLITRQSTTFARPISPRAFHGEFVLGQALTSRFGGRAEPLVSLQTRFRFGDDAGGACHGEVRVAVVPA